MIHDPGGTGFRIDALWGFFAIDESDDSEGICAFRTPDGWMPMVASDEARVESLRPIAVEVARKGKKRIRLVRFDQRTDVEVIEP